MATGQDEKNKKPEYIYRRTKDPADAKTSVGLTNKLDIVTGLSFGLAPFPSKQGASLKFSVEKLEAGGFTVEPNGGRLHYDVFTGESIGDGIKYGSMHISVYINNKHAMTDWYAEDEHGTSVYTELLFSLRETAG